MELNQQQQITLNKIDLLLAEFERSKKRVRNGDAFYSYNDIELTISDLEILSGLAAQVRGEK